MLKQTSLKSSDVSVEGVEKLRQPSMPVEEDSQPISLMVSDDMNRTKTAVDKVQVMNELEKHGLGEVVRMSGTPGHGGSASIDPDYFLRLINCLKILSQPLNFSRIFRPDVNMGRRDRGQRISQNIKPYNLQSRKLCDLHPCRKSRMSQICTTWNKYLH